MEMNKEEFKSAAEAFASGMRDLVDELKTPKIPIIESEEAEVKKDIEWLKGRIRGRKIFKPQNDREIGYNMAIDEFSEYVNQLDEPETLSQEWLVEHSYNVHLLGTPDVETVAVPRDDLEGILVPKQELPVIPKFVADYIDDRKEVGFPIYQAIRIVRENSRFEHSHLREWLWTNKGQETFARAWLDGYEVAKKQKYVVLNKSTMQMILHKANDTINPTVTDFEYYTKTKNKCYEFTESEIKDYNKSYWPFAVPVEELEE